MEVVSQNDSANIIYRPHPALPAINKSIQYAVKEGSTVRQVLMGAGIDSLQPIIITLDDKPLTIKEWDEVCPKAGQIINVHATVMGGGGGGGSNVLQAVAMIALMITVSYFTMGAGAAMIGLEAGSLAAMGAGAVSMIAGSMIINAVFKASTPGIETNSGTYSSASPTYSLSGGSNRIRKYESMPIVMGTMKFYPDLASKPFTEFQGDDQYLYQIFNLGLSDLTLSDWKIGTNSITDYTDYTWYSSDSLGKISAFPGNVDTISGASLTNESGWITRTSSISTYKLGIDIVGTLYYANNNGGLDSTSVQLRIQYKPTGSSTWLTPETITTSDSSFVAGSYQEYAHYVEQGEWQYGDTDDGWGITGWLDTSYYETRTRFVAGSGGTVIITGASQKATRATLFIDVDDGEYDVRVIRDTADSSDSRLQNSTTWDTLRSYQLDTSSYVGQTRKGLVIKASSQLSGTISQLSVTASANANYLDGTAWVYGETSNPAHWFMDFAKGRYDVDGNLVYGTGLSSSQIDLDSLASWATFCDDEGLTFNAVFDGSQTAADVFTAIARCGFASPSWATGKIGVVWDARNASPVAAFGMSNILKGSFSVNYITEQLAEEVIVSYLNPDDDWVQDQVRVSVPDITNPTRSSSIDLLGCTNETMAGKFANYLAAQQYYRTRRITWDCDFEGFVCQRGDVVLLSHDLTQWGYSGRVVSHSGNTITLNRSVPRNGSAEYLMLKKPDGTMTTYTVVASSTESDTVTLTSTPDFDSDMLDMDHVWFFSPLATTGKKVKILSVQPQSESRVRVVATDEYEEFYEAWDGTWTSTSSSTLLLSSTPTISNITITESLYRKTTGIVSKVLVAFSVSGTFERANIRYKIGGGSWNYDTTNIASYEFDATETGLLTIEITPISTIAGAAVTKTQTIYGLTLPPSDVTSFVIDGSRLTWTSVSDIDLAGYLIKYHFGSNTNWATGNLLHEGLITDSPYTMQVVPSGEITLMIKAVDTTGNESDNIAYIIKDMGDTPVLNVVESYDFKANAWAGSYSNASIVSSNLQATQTDPFFSSDLGSFYGEDFASFYSTNYDAIEWISDSWTPDIAAVGSTLKLAYEVSGDLITIQYRPAGPSSFFDSDLVYFFGDDGSLFFDPTPDWMSWPGAISAESIDYQFKVTTGIGSTEGLLSEFNAFVDVPDISLSLSGISLSSSGTRLTGAIGKFTSIQNIQMTLQGGSSATYLEIVDKNATLGPLVIAKNSSGSGVAATIDALLQGH